MEFAESLIGSGEEAPYPVSELHTRHGRKNSTDHSRSLKLGEKVLSGRRSSCRFPVCGQQLIYLPDFVFRKAPENIGEVIFRINPATTTARQNRIFYKHFYPGGQEETWRQWQGNRKKWGWKQAPAGMGPGKGLYSVDRDSVQALTGLFPERAAGDCTGVQTHCGRTGVRLDHRTSAAASALLRDYGRCAGRRPGLERILRFAAAAFAVPEDAANDAGIRNKGYDTHAAAARAQQGIGLEDFPDQARPGAAGFPGAIGIVLHGDRGRQAGGWVLPGRRANPAAVGVGAIKSLTMPSWVGDMRRNAVDPLERIQFDRSCAGPGIGRRIQDQGAVVELFERIDGQYRPGDIPGLGFDGSGLRSIHRRTRIHRKSRMHPG